MSEKRYRVVILFVRRVKSGAELKRRRIYGLGRIKNGKQ